MRRLAPLLALLALLCAAAPAQAAGRCGAHPWCDVRLDPDRRAALLLPALTPNEKFGLMSANLDLRSGRLVTSVAGVARVGVPPLTLTDGPAGLGASGGRATALPAPLALAASFDGRLARAHGRVVGQEAAQRGHDMLLAPTMNVARDPRGGRTFEGYGEDPYLVGVTAAQWIRGLQSTGTIATAKHYAANSQELNRTTIDARVGERALREIYLPHFEAAVRSGRVGAVMSAYNRVNGAFMGANRPLLRDVLRGSFGFRGFVISDFLANGDTVGSAQAGQSVSYPAHYYGAAELRRAVGAGRLSMATVDELVGHYLRTLFRFGVPDRFARPRDGAVAVGRHGRVARQVEGEGIVLLQNRSRLLPLRRPRSIAVIGSAAGAYQGRQPGSSTPGSTRTTPSPASRASGAAPAAGRPSATTTAPTAPGPRGPPAGRAWRSCSPRRSRRRARGRIAAAWASTARAAARTP